MLIAPPKALQEGEEGSDAEVSGSRGAPRLGGGGTGCREVVSAAVGSTKKRTNKNVRECRIGWCNTV